MDEELENEVLHLCFDKDKAVICLEELISVVKGEQKETENSYLGLVFIADTIGKLNLFLTSFFNSNKEGGSNEPVIKTKDEFWKDFNRKAPKEAKEVDYESMWEEFMNKK